MAVIAANARTVTTPTTLNKTVLTAADTLVFKPTVSQALYLHNTTAGALTVVIDGSGGTTINPRGYGGALDVSAGKSIPVAAGDLVMVDLQSISAFCQGATVAVTGGTGITAFIVEG